jgi:hypothetical protein
VLLLPTLLLPSVRRLRKEVNDPLDRRVVRKHEKNVALRIRFLCLIDRFDCSSHINDKHRVKEWLVWLAAALDVELSELRPFRTDRDPSRSNVVWQGELHFIWKGNVRCGTELSAVMNCVATQKDERVWIACCAD